MWKLKFNLKAYLSTAALPSQTTKTALTEEFMFQNVAYRPTVYITGVHTAQACNSDQSFTGNCKRLCSTAYYSMIGATCRKMNQSSFGKK